MLKGKKSQYNPPYPSRWSVGPGGQQDQEHGVVLHDQEEGHRPPITFRSGSSQVPQGQEEVVSMSVEEVSLYLLDGDPITYFGLVPIDPRSSFWLQSY